MNPVFSRSRRYAAVDLAGIVAAVAGRYRSRCGASGQRLSEQLDHPAQRIGTVQAAHRSGHDLDACNLGRRQVLERSGAAGGVVQADAVEQHQGVAAVGAAQENAAGLTGPAVGDDLDVGLLLQQLGERVLPAALDDLAR